MRIDTTIRDCEFLTKRSPRPTNGTSTKGVPMADLQEAANQFIEHLISQNMQGLMATFTPEGMSKAMALGQGPQGQQGAPTRKEAVLLPTDGDDHPVDLILGNEDGEAIIGTVWCEINGDWKVKDIHIKQQP
jgi:hypothetical protein